MRAWRMTSLSVGVGRAPTRAPGAQAAGLCESRAETGSPFRGRAEILGPGEYARESKARQHELGSRRLAGLEPHRPPESSSRGGSQLLDERSLPRGHA